MFLVKDISSNEYISHREASEVIDMKIELSFMHYSS